MALLIGLWQNTELGVCKKHSMHITLSSFQKQCSSFSFGYSDILKFIIVNKSKCFPKLIPTSWHNPVYLSEIQTKYLCLHYIGRLQCLQKKELKNMERNIIQRVKGNVFFYKYVCIKIRLQMKKKVFFLYIKTNNV